MTKLPREFCPECRKPFKSREAVHGLTREHWTCYERREKTGRELRDIIDDKDWKPKPDKLVGPDANGWLSPDGVFYANAYGVHETLGGALAKFFYKTREDSRHLEERDWMHINRGGATFGFMYSRDESRERLSQSQRDALWDWFRTLERPASNERLVAYTTLQWLLKPEDDE